MSGRRSPGPSKHLARQATKVCNNPACYKRLSLQESATGKYCSQCSGTGIASFIEELRETLELFCPPSFPTLRAEPTLYGDDPLHPYKAIHARNQLAEAPAG